LSEDPDVEKLRKALEKKTSDFLPFASRKGRIRQGCSAQFLHEFWHGFKILQAQGSLGCDPRPDGLPKARRSRLYLLRASYIQRLFERFCL